MGSMGIEAHAVLESGDFLNNRATPFDYNVLDLTGISFDTIYELGKNSEEVAPAYSNEEYLQSAEKWDTTVHGLVPMAPLVRCGVR